MVRVIAGEARGRKLNTLDKETTKPTLDRVKEAMFSMLMPYLQGARVLDLFGGNGALGIEALSRGASYCTFCDCEVACARVIKGNLQSVGFVDKAEVFASDFGELIEKKKKEKYDLVLMDPPYKKGLEREALRLISDKMTGQMIVMVEHSAEDAMEDKIGKFEKVKDKRYGTVGLTIYVKGE